MQKQSHIFLIIWHALCLKCPFCFNGSLFKSYLKLAPHCNVCHQSFEKADTGDGPAFFVMSIIGIMAAIAMISIELLYEPSIWVHIISQIIIIIGGSLLLLPMTKSLLIHLQYHFNAVQSYQNKQ